MDLGGLTALILMGGGLAGMVWLLVRFDTARRRALSEVATELGLVPMVGPEQAFEGVVSGFPVRMGAGWKGVAQGEGVVMENSVEVALDPPLDFEFTIMQAGAWPMRDLSIEEDPQFNRVCALQTADPERLRALLAAPELRERIRDAVRDRMGCCWVTQGGVLIKVVDAHLKRGPESLRRAVRQAGEIARGLRRAAAPERTP